MVSAIAQAQSLPAGLIFLYRQGQCLRLLARSVRIMAVFQRIHISLCNIFPMYTQLLIILTTYLCTKRYTYTSLFFAQTSLAMAYDNASVRKNKIEKDQGAVVGQDTALLTQNFLGFQKQNPHEGVQTLKVTNSFS